MHEPETSAWQDPWPWVGWLVGLAGLSAHSLQLQPWTLDDAFISMRYAENFANGHGLVYNPGEFVEGYTTFAWVFLLGIGHALGLSTLTLAKGLGLAFTVATLGLVAHVHRIVPGWSARQGGVAAALMGTCGVTTSWAMPGMEVPLVALSQTVLLLATARLLHDGRGAVIAGVAGALALMTRPDAIIVVAICSLAWIACFLRDRTATSLAGFLPLFGLYVPYFAWRFLTYGWLLPNTFYAKVGATEAQVWRGLDYVGEASMALGVLVVLALLGVRRWSAAQLPLAGALVLQVAYVIAVGGDVMPAFRFFAGLLPALALLAAHGVLELRRPALVAAAVVGAILVNLAVFEYHPDLRERIGRGVVGRNGEEVGRWMAANLPPDTLLATNTAGSVPYFSGLRTVDMLGLNDAHIAHRTMPRMGEGQAGHEKADGAYVWSRDPDVVQFGSARGRAKPAFRSDRELARQPGFKERYVLRTYPLPSGARLRLWVRRTWVDDGTAP